MRIGPHSSDAQHAPGHYEIRLQGHLDQRWVARFEGLGFSHELDGTTLLTGSVIDQAALFGLLRTVRDLGMPLIAVTLIEGKTADAPDSGTDGDDHGVSEEFPP